MPSKPPKTVKFAPEKAVASKEKSHMNAITLFSAVILAIIVVTFIGAPVVQKIVGSSNHTFGYYDGIPVEYMPGNYFAQQVDQLNRYYGQFKNTDSNSERRLVWQQAFENAAQRIALKDLATKGGVLVTDEAIDRAMVDFPDFQKDGHFSNELYNQFKQTKPDTLMQYRNDTGTQLLIRQYVGDLVNAPLVSTADVSFIQQMAYPQKKFSFVVFNEKDFPDAQVLSYATKNQNLFRSINLSRITLNSQGDAQRVRDLAMKGTQSFADLAKTYSKDSLAETGGALNTMLYHDLQSEFADKAELDKVFALKKGAISPIFQKDKKWTIYKVMDATTEPDLTKSSTLDEVRTYIQNNDRGVLEDYLMKQAKSFFTDAGSNFDQAAKKNHLTVETTDFLSLNFDNLSLFPSIAKASKNPAFQNLAANTDFFKLAFPLAKGQVSPPVLASPYVLVLKVTDVRDSAPPAAVQKGKIALPAPEITADQVKTMAERDRSQALQQNLLNTPLFQDQFNTSFSELK